MGNVEQFVDIVPKRVVLRGFAGNPIKAKVKIIPKDKYPFTIKKAKTTNILPILYKNGYPVGSTEIIAGCHHDAYNLEKNIRKFFKDLKQRERPSTPPKCST